MDLLALIILGLAAYGAWNLVAGVVQAWRMWAGAED
jgi:hypothetical protein